MPKIAAFLAGVYEFRRSLTTRYGSETLRHYYELGREFAHRVTFRRYDD